ncbi:dipeptidase [Lentilactobacillus kosonis]|uniref:Dipeptidase n=1 Tax=Lentilactobacillus kosonis TaxID=2810561 RepID=A0A401FJ18_9LACO|nr:dipeptidase [Lentilactobacillus kosonis]
MKVPDNKYAVIPNQLMIGKINFNDSNNYLVSNTLKSFVKRNKLVKSVGNNINFADIFGTNDSMDAKYNRPRVWDGQRYLTPSKKQSPNAKTFFDVFKT